MRKAHGWSFLVAGCIAAPAMAGPGVWTTNGPDGGSTNYLVIDAGLPNTLVAAARGGLFRSVDAGTSWERFENGLLYSFPYALEASDASSTLFVAPSANTLFRSQSGGAWTPTGLVLPPTAVLLDVSLRAGSDQHLVVTSTDGLQRSSDGGATFVPLAAAGLPLATDVVRIEDAGGGRLYAGYSMPIAPATAQVYRSDDDGATWSATSDLPAFGDYLRYRGGDLRAAPSDADRVYFVTDQTVYRSNDGGNAWTTCDAAIGPHGRLQVSATDPNVVWLASGEGFLSSTDGCATWTVSANGLRADGTRVDTLTDVALPAGFPLDSRVWVASENGGIYRSADNGSNFSASHVGLASTNIRAIAMNPADPSRILLGYGDAASPSATLFRSTDGGGSWTRSNGGLNALQIRGITIDPTTAAMPAGGHVYAVGSSRPQYSPSGPELIDGGIYKSLDGGVNWTTIDNGLPDGYFGMRFIGTVRNLVLDPRSCASPPPSGACTSGPLQTAYVTASGLPNYTSGTYTAARIYKSTDAGASWTAAESGLPMPSRVGDCFTSQVAVPLVIDPTSPQTLYVGLTVGNSNASCAERTIANGIFKSTDGGATWVHSSNGLARIGGPGSSHYSVLALAIDPSNPSTLYAGGYRDISESISGRVFKSTDAGATWHDISVGIAGADVRALLVDPTDPLTVYAGIGGGTLANPSGVYRSTDGGLSWNSFSIGLPADAATALALDPSDADRLLAGTIGGLWEFTRVPDPDSDDAASSVENAAPNGGDANEDGVPDAEQSNVASFNGSLGLAKGGLPQITLDVEPLAGTCARINNAHALPGDSLPADTARGVAATSFDRGVLRFELPDCERARVTVQFHAADFGDVDWTWRNYGPTTPGQVGSFDWYTFDGARKIGTDRWELIIDAAARGNYRGSDDTILFVGAPGFVDIHVFGDGLE